MPRSRAIVVVAYGGIEYLQEALGPLSDENVIVVDNSSAQATKELVTELGHHYIDSGANLGFSGGVNIGLREVARQGGVTDVLLLNPDAHIEPSGIDVMQDHLLADPLLAAVAPALVTGEGEVQLTTYPLPSPSQMWRFALGLPQGHRNPDFVIGAALLLRAEALADVGELDERYFLYCEEADWQRRAFDRGWRVAVVTAAQALHHVGMSSSDDDARIARVTAGQDTYVRRWYGARSSASYRFAGWLAMKLRTRQWETARFHARCFRIGPRRIAPLPPAPRPLAILHVALKGATSPEIDAVVAQQTLAGHQVVVAGSFRSALRALRAPTAYDVVHAHGQGAVVAACLTGAWHGTRVARSGEPGRGSLAGRAAVGLVGRRVDLQVPWPPEADAQETYRTYAVAAGRRNTNRA